MMIGDRTARARGPGARRLSGPLSGCKGYLVTCACGISPPRPRLKLGESLESDMTRRAGSPAAARPD
eukprot:766000-Hanusia_phi.AAC.5